MRAEEDFEAYAAARWASLVRVLVLVGCPEPLAPGVALDGLARCHRDWEQLRHDADVEVVVHAAVLEAWSRRRAEPWWQRVPAGSRQVPADVDAALDRLPPRDRAAVVLADVAGLGRDEVADVLGCSADDLGTVPRPRLPDLRGLALDPEPVPTTFQLRAAARTAGRAERARGVRAVALLAALAVVAALFAGVVRLLPGEGEPVAEDVLGPVPVERDANPVEVVWYAGGVLHLPAVRLALPSVVDLEPVAGGAVYLDGRGRVVLVLDDGTRTELGRTEPRSRVVASQDGWVSWHDLGTGDLVLHDAFADEELDRVPGRDQWPIAIDDGRLYYADASGSYQLTPGDGADGPVGDSSLLDVRAARLAFADPGGVRLVRPLLDQELLVPGDGARLRDDGGMVMTRTTGTRAYGDVRLFDTFTGRELPSGIGPAEVALDATFGPDGTVVYVVAREEDRPDADEFGRSSFSGALELRTCDPRTGSCTVDLSFPSTGAAPVLAD